jgi:hypothetical protein
VISPCRIRLVGREIETPTGMNGHDGCPAVSMAEEDCFLLIAEEIVVAGNIWGANR